MTWLENFVSVEFFLILMPEKNILILKAEAGASSGLGQVVVTTYKSNKAPSDVDITLDDSTYPRYI